MAEMSREDRLHKIEDGSTERISVEDAIEVLSHPCYYECFEVLNIAHRMAIEALSQPEIIHCGECMYSFEYGECLFCNMHNTVMGEEDYCSQAERRTDDT